jgi:hypothetical protein
LINEELFAINGMFDTLYSEFGNHGVTISSVTYVFGAWRWHNSGTPSYPAGLYMGDDTDTPPWASADFDSILSYRAASKVLLQIADDTNRSAEYATRADSLLRELVNDEYVQWNMYLLNASENTLSETIKQTMRCMLLVEDFYKVEWSFVETTNRLINEIYETYDAYKWLFSRSDAVTNLASAWGEYKDMFAYGLASRISAEKGLSQELTAALDAEYKSRLNSAIQFKIVNASQPTAPIDSIRRQVRDILGEHASNLTDFVINSFIDDSYLSLASQYDWKWLQSEAVFSISSGDYSTSIGSLNQRINKVLNVYRVTHDELDTDPNTARQIVETVARIPHLLDGKTNDSNYRYNVTAVEVTGPPPSYDVMPLTLLQITPAPNEDISLKVRYIVEPTPLLSGGSILFDARFIRILTYSAAAKVLSFTDKGDKKLIPYFYNEVERMTQDMHRYYQTDASTDSFSMGEAGLNTPKYIPFFRIG